MSWPKQWEDMRKTMKLESGTCVERFEEFPVVHLRVEKVAQRLTEKDQIEVSKLRLESGFSTLRMELEAIYPQLNEEQIKELVIEIEAEKSNSQQEVIGEINGAPSVEGDVNNGMEPDLQNQPA